MLIKLNRHLTRVSVLLIMAALIAGMAGCDGDGYTPTSKDLEIWDWYDLDAVRDNVYGNHILMSNLDSTTPGYAKLASEAANGGKGWKPIIFYFQGVPIEFRGTFDGQGYEIRDLFINRPGEDNVGLFDSVDGVIQDIGVVNATVIGGKYVGGLVGLNRGTLSNSYSTGSVIGAEYDTYVGGLVGYNLDGTVSNCHSSCTVTGDKVGGLVGRNTRPVSTTAVRGIVSNSYSTGNVTGNKQVGGLVGDNTGTVSDSYATGSVNGNERVGGLVGNNYRGTVSDSYSIGNVTGNLHVGGLVGRSNEATVNNSYASGNVTGEDDVGGLVGLNYFGADVINSYSIGNVIGDLYVGGLVGNNVGNVTNCYSAGNVDGTSLVGGLVGDNIFEEDSSEGIATNSFWDTETSGQDTSDGGTGKNTTEMKSIATFSGAGWDIIAVALNETNPTYTWNIVNNVTYPFLSWQP